MEAAPAVLESLERRHGIGIAAEILAPGTTG
jgi:hypothetical protein